MNGTVREIRAQFIAVVSGFKQQINKAVDSVQEIGTETEKSVDKANRSLDDLSKGLKSLNKTLSNSGKADEFKDLSAALDDVQKEFEQTGKVSKDTMKNLQKELSKSKDSLEELGKADAFDGMIREISRVEGSLDELDKVDFRNLIGEINRSEQALSGLNSADLSGLQSEIDQTSFTEVTSGANRASGSVGELNNESLSGLRSEADRTSASLSEVGAAGTDAGNKAEAGGEAAGAGFYGAIGAVTAFTTAVAGAVIGLVGFVKSGIDLQKTMNNVQIRTGATNAEMAKFRNNIMNVYKGGYGEGFSDIADAMVRIEQTTNLSGKALEDATKQALLFRDEFGYEVPESMKTVNVMMKQFGITSEQAFNLLAQGQQQGLDYADDMLDTFWEYSVYFKQLGYDANGMFDVLKAGADAGAFNLDKVGDAIKEFGIRVKDGSKTTNEAFSDLGLDAGEMQEMFAKGGDTAQKALQTVFDKLQKVNDKTVKNTAAVNLFGTMYEDLEENTIAAMNNVQKSGDMTADTMKKIDEIHFDNIGAAFTGLWRWFNGSFLIPLQSQAMPAINNFANNAKRTLDAITSGDNQKISDLLESWGLNDQQINHVFVALNKVKDAFAAVRALASGDEKTGVNLLQKLGLNENQINNIVNLFSTLKSYMSTAIGVFKQFASAIGGFFSGLWDLIGPYIMPALDAVVGFVQETLAKIIGFWNTDGQQIMQAAQNVFNFILSIIKFVMPVVLAIIQSVWGNIKGVISGALNIIMGLVRIFTGLFTGDFSKMWQGIKQLFAGAIQFVWNLVNLLFIGKIIGGIKSLVKTGLTFLKDFWTKIPTLFQTGVTKANKFISDMVVKILGFLKNLAINAVKAVWNMFTGIIKWFANIRTNAVKIFNAMKNTIQAIYNAIKNAVIASVKFMVSKVVGFFKSLYNTGKKIFTDTKNFFTSIWNKIKDSVVNAAKNMWNGARKKFTDMKNGISKIFTSVKDGIKKKFDDIVEFAKKLPGRIGSGIKKMASKVGDGIKSLANTMNKKLALGVNGVIGGINWVLDTLKVPKKVGRVKKWEPPQYAKGTGGHPGGPMIVGDGRKKELVQYPDGTTFLSPATDTLVPNAPAGTKVLSGKDTETLLKSVPMYKNGDGSGISDFLGFVGGKVKQGAQWVGSKVKQGADYVKDKAEELWGYVTDPKKLLKKGLEMTGFSMPEIPAVAKATPQILGKLVDGGVSYLKDKLSDFSFLGDSNAPGNVKSWIAQAVAITKSPTSWIEPLITIAMRESGGRTGPSTINKWDINWKRGTPSMGLMQTIKPTFDSFKMKGHGNIMNPVDNAIAAIRYIKHRYGTPMNTPGLRSLAAGGPYKGYENGGRVFGKQLAWLAENPGVAEWVIPEDGSANAYTHWANAGIANGFMSNDSGSAAPRSGQAAPIANMDETNGKLSQVVEILREIADSDNEKVVVVREISDVQGKDTRIKAFKNGVV